MKESTTVHPNIYIIGPILASTDERFAQARVKMLAAVAAKKKQMEILKLVYHETDNCDKIGIMVHQWQAFGEAFNYDTSEILRLLGKK